MDQAAGKMKKAMGNMMGNERMEAEGAAQDTKGKAESMGRNTGMGHDTTMGTGMGHDNTMGTGMGRDTTMGTGMGHNTGMGHDTGMKMEGMKNRAEGAVQSNMNSATGNTTGQMEGEAQRAKGHAQTRFS